MTVPVRPTRFLRRRVLAAAVVALSLTAAPPAQAGPADPIVCPVNAGLAGTYGPMTINAQGDVFVNGEPQWDCPPYDGAPPQPPRPTGHVTIHRFPGQAPSLLAAPVTATGAAWWCVDIHNGRRVTSGDTLASPDPGVYCTPPDGYSTACTSVEAGGYFTSTTRVGAAIVTSACNGLQATWWMAHGTSGTSGPVFGDGRTPWVCQIDEFVVDPLLTDYWAFCHVNVP